jgi:hypothetical protein
MASGEKLALAAVAGLAFISALSRKRKGAMNDLDPDDDEGELDDDGVAEQGYDEFRTAPFDSSDGFPPISQISEGNIRYKMWVRSDGYGSGRVSHAIDEEAIRLYIDDEDGQSEDVYHALEHEDYVYIPAPGVDIRSVMDVSIWGPQMRKALKIREIVLPKDYPSTRAGQVVDAVFFNDGTYGYLRSAHWLSQVLDYFDQDDEKGPKAVIDMYTTVYQLLRERFYIEDTSGIDKDALRRAVRLFEHDENMLTAAVLSILLGDGILEPDNLKPSQVLHLLREVGKDALAQVREEFPQGFEFGASALGRPTVTIGGARIPFVLPKGSRSARRRSS